MKLYLVQQLDLYDGAVETHRIYLNEQEAVTEAQELQNADVADVEYYTEEYDTDTHTFSNSKELPK